MVNQRLKTFVNWKVRAGLFCQRYVKSREIEERDGERNISGCSRSISFKP